MRGRQQHTLAVPRCEKHPPLREWPMKALVKQSCPVCGAREVYGEREIGRMVRARQLIRERAKP